MPATVDGGVVLVDVGVGAVRERGTKKPTPAFGKALAVLLDEMERLAGEARR